MSTMTTLYKYLLRRGLAILSGAASLQCARAELDEWKYTVNNTAQHTQLVYLNTTMVTSPQAITLPPISGDRTYEFICYITEGNTDDYSVALMGNGGFAYKLYQWNQAGRVAGSTRYGISDDLYTPLSFESTHTNHGENHIHYVVQADGTALLYLNGTLRGTMAAGLQPVLSGPVTLGHGGLNRGDAFGNGYILATAVYDKALSSSEVSSRSAAWKTAYEGPAGIETEIRKDRPAHWWRLNEQFATQPAADAGMASPLPGTYMGGCQTGQASVNGTFGGAVRLAGNEFSDPGRIVVPNVPQFRNFTIEAWMYLDADASAIHFPVVTHETPEAYSSLLLAPYPNRMRGTLSVIGGQSAEEFGAPQVGRGKWHHVAIRAGGLLSIHVDGLETQAPVGGLDRDIDNGASAGTLTIGSVLGGLFGFNFGFKGMIDEVVLYSYVLPAERIQQHYLAGGGSGPWGYSSVGGSDNPYDSTVWDQIMRPVMWDAGRLGVLSVAPASPVPAAPESAPLWRLQDGALGDDGLDSTASPGANGVADGFHFADSNENSSGRLLMTFPEPIMLNRVDIWTGADKALYPGRARIAGTVWLTGAATLPSTAGDLSANPAWKKMGTLWGYQRNQSYASVMPPRGGMGPIKYLLFEFDTGGDSQFDVLREIDVRGGPAISQPDLQIALVGPKKVRLSWKAEYENWYIGQHIDDPRYDWTASFMPGAPVVENFRWVWDYDIPAEDVWYQDSKRGQFRMNRGASQPVE
jgi:hypothetical protein